MEISDLGGQKKKSSKVCNLVADGLALTAIFIFGWFLIGYYVQYEYLDTGYQDWIYHAFRIKDILQFGISSWDHIWANGINHWRAFQYIEHLTAILVIKLFGVSIPQAMLWLTVSVFILIRVFIYLILRYLGVSCFFSFFAVLMSFATSQEWIAMKDFSIYIAFIFIPIYVLVWIKTVDDMKYVYLLSALTGASWSLHPVIGYSTAGMLFLLALANNLKKDFGKSVFVLLIFFTSLLPFSLPYLTSGYIITNVHSSTEKFLQQLLAPEYMGLSLVFFILIALSWILLVVKSSESPRWAKLLLFYATAYLLFIYFGLLGYYPSFINKLQFSRAVPFIAFVLIFVFGAFLQAAFSKARSRMFFTILIVISAVSITQSIEIASLYSGQPVHHLSQDPVAAYFSDKDLPKGSIYIKDVAWPSYFGKQGLRFITSYNRYPNPYPIRFNTLMKTDISFTGVTAYQIKMISDYSLVLGVEYLFVPQLSPLVDGLTNDSNDLSPNFVKDGEIQVASDVYVVLRNMQPISLAYGFEEREKEKLLRFEDLPIPSIQATSFKSWDEEISRTAELIRKGAFVTLPLTFDWPDKLRVDLTGLDGMQDPNVVLMQSFDRGWSIQDYSKDSIQPTNLRFMDITLKQGSDGKELLLKNSWPKWHWPVQTLGLVTIVLALITLVVTELVSAAKSRSNKVEAL